ncbi:MAG: DUF3644 domain-containing protein [Dehalococcoidia bacterium]
MAKKRVASVQALLLAKSREAALNAVQAYNNPLTVFKAEAFIVMMVIAWTYLLHAHYRRERIEYRYFKIVGTRRRFERVRSGAYKYWELERCLNERACPLDSATRQNLRFLIELRHEIEHHQPPGLEAYVGSKFQACCLNYEFWLTTLFGEGRSVAPKLSLALQFLDISLAPEGEPVASAVSAPLANFIRDFEAGLSEEDFNSPRYEYRILFTRRLVNHPGQADRVIEFVNPSSEIGQVINKEYWATKHTDRPKYLPKSIIARMRERGYVRFNMHHHTKLWKERNARANGKGYGIQVEGTWYWYDSWISEVEKHCNENQEKYAEPA